MKYTIPKFELIRLLLRHRRIADNRSLSAMENKVAKFFIYLSMLILVIYLMGLAILFSQLTNSDNTATATENLFIGMPFLLLVDFGMRFTMQQTSSSLIYCYLCRATHVLTLSSTTRSSVKATSFGSHSYYLMR